MSGDDDLELELHSWHWWEGVSGLYYARRMKSSPPVVLRAENMDELQELVRQHIASRQLGNPPQVL
jgi:hypothetical protein